MGVHVLEADKLVFRFGTTKICDLAQWMRLVNIFPVVILLSKYVEVPLVTQFWKSSSVIRKIYLSIGTKYGFLVNEIRSIFLLTCKIHHLLNYTQMQKSMSFYLKKIKKRM